MTASPGWKDVAIFLHSFYQELFTKHTYVTVKFAVNVHFIMLTIINFF